MIPRPPLAAAALLACSVLRAQAPELHFPRGKWYIYFAADGGTKALLGDAAAAYCLCGCFMASNSD
jgi:hypothetical protein